MHFGIMQGRLSKAKKGILQFLPKNWKVEYDLLNKANLDYIELFTKRYNDRSPIWNKRNSDLKKKISQTKLKKIILCDNHVFETNLLCDNYKNYFNKLISKLSLFQKPLLIIPIDDIFFEKNNYQKLIDTVFYFINISKKKDVEISFEVQVNLKIILKFKKDLKNEFFKITFDTGNIFLIDKNNKNLVNYLDKAQNLINHIHLKDRNKSGDNVILGTGLINFKNIIKCLKKNKYDKTFTFETNRGDNHLKTAKNNLIYLRKHFN